MFRLIILGHTATLLPLAQQFKQVDNKSAMLHCLQEMFRLGVRLQSATTKTAMTTLQAFREYVLALRDVIITVDPCRHPHIARLFAIEPLGNDAFSVPRGSFLFDAADRMRTPYLDRDSRACTILHKPLTDLLRGSLANLVTSKVKDYAGNCLRSPAFTPCLNYILQDGKCPRENCPKSHLTSATSQIYNDLIELHLVHMRILQVTLHRMNGKEAVQTQRYLLSKSLGPNFH